MMRWLAVYNSWRVNNKPRETEDIRVSKEYERNGFLILLNNKVTTQQRKAKEKNPVVKDDDRSPEIVKDKIY